MNNGIRTTRERIFERYHSSTRRPTIDDPKVRESLFKSFERRFASFLPNERDAAIFEVGCGEGHFLSYLKTQGYSNLGAFDISPENVSICHRSGLPFVTIGNLLSLSEAPVMDHYDIIFAMDVIEHIPKDLAASVIDALRIRLKPDGILIAQLPNMAHLLGTYYRYHDLTHEFGVNEKSAIDLFMASGFSSQSVAAFPSWEAATSIGRLREIYVRLLHGIIFLMDGAERPHIPTKNLIVRAQA